MAIERTIESLTNIGRNRNDPYAIVHVKKWLADDYDQLAKTA